MIGKFPHPYTEDNYDIISAFLNEYKRTPGRLSGTQVNMLASICKKINYTLRDKTCGVCLKNAMDIITKYLEVYQNQHEMVIKAKQDNVIKQITELAESTEQITVTPKKKGRKPNGK